jgi:hypothetical protein
MERIKFGNQIRSFKEGMASTGGDLHMSNVTGQILALVGVVIGIFGTIIATAVADRSRWKREKAARWDERRLDAYAEYAKAVKEIHKLTLRLTAARVSFVWADPIDRDSGLQILAQADAHRTTVWENVLLLGDAATVSAARDWWEAVRELVMYARDRTDGDLSEKVRLAVRHSDEERDRFYREARDSIGVSGGSVEQAWRLPSAQAYIPEGESRDIKVDSPRVKD